ncbi:MAG TPA: hypothetical protein VGM90_04445 [Kofleriaceae bacterium]
MVELVGTNSGDVYAIGRDAIAHWDGKTWSDVEIPDVKGDVFGGWTDGKQLIIVTNDWDKSTSWIYRRDEKGAWSLDGRSKGVLLNVGGSSDALYAIGNQGLILHRIKSGAWRDETVQHADQYSQIYAASVDDIYIAGSSLLHSRGDGKWSDVKLPTTESATTVWGRSSNDVFAGTMGELFHFDGHAWSKTGWTRDVGPLAGNAKMVLVTNLRDE